jgi:hypothetical protein
MRRWHTSWAALRSDLHERELLHRHVPHQRADNFGRFASGCGPIRDPRVPSGYRRPRLSLRPHRNPVDARGLCGIPVSPAVFGSHWRCWRAAVVGFGFRRPWIGGLRGLRGAQGEVPPNRLSSPPRPHSPPSRRANATNRASFRSGASRGSIIRYASTVERSW